jgi:hypothetical protein
VARHAAAVASLTFGLYLAWLALQRGAPALTAPLADANTHAAHAAHAARDGNAATPPAVRAVRVGAALAVVAAAGVRARRRD